MVMCGHENLESRHIKQSFIDYKRSKDLVRTCEEEYKAYCETKSDSNILGLEVVHSKTQQVIKAPDHCE